MCCLPNLHKTNIKDRFVVTVSWCSEKALAGAVSSAFLLIYKRIHAYIKKCIYSI